jgi:superfamily I DNA/RNA helicase
MTIFIPQSLFYYYLLSVVFESIYLYIIFNKNWKQIKENKTLYSFFNLLVDQFKKMKSTQFIIKQIFNVRGYFIAFIIICFIAPFLFPFSLFSLFKKIIGYKSKLEKQANEEARKVKEAQEKPTFSSSESDNFSNFFDSEPIIQETNEIPEMPESIEPFEPLKTPEENKSTDNQEKIDRDDLIKEKFEIVKNYGKEIEGKTFTSDEKNNMAKAVIFNIKWRQVIDFINKHQNTWSKEEEDEIIELLDFIIQICESTDETWDLFWSGNQPYNPAKMPFIIDSSIDFQYIDLNEVNSITFPLLGFNK